MIRDKLDQIKIIRQLIAHKLNQAIVDKISLELTKLVLISWKLRLLFSNNFDKNLNNILVIFFGLPWHIQHLV